MEPIENSINPRLSLEIVQLFRARGWTDARVARAIRVSQAYMERIDASQQSFSPQHVRMLARALKMDVHRLFFEAMEPAALKSKARELWLSTKRVLDASDAFRASLRARPTKKKRRPRVKAA
jgi:transcriptional regulator with XRE-family HTH domain